MLGKKIIKEVNKKDILNYKFNINDPVYSTKHFIKNAIIVSRNRVNNQNFYKIKNLLNPNSELITCKETELIHR